MLKFLGKLLPWEKPLSHHGTSYVAINCLHVWTANLPNFTKASCAWLHSIPVMQPRFSPFQGSPSTNKRAWDTAGHVNIPQIFWIKFSFLRITLVAILVSDFGQQHPRALAVGSKEDGWWGPRRVTPRITYTARRTSAHLHKPANHSPLLFWAFSHSTHTLYSKAYLTNQIFCRWTKNLPHQKRFINSIIAAIIINCVSAAPFL